jgi:hypothetical protein
LSTRARSARHPVLEGDYVRDDFRAWKSRQRLLVVAVFLPLFASTILAKIGVPPLGGMGFGVSMPLTIVVAALMACVGAFVVQTERLFLYLLLVGTMGFIQALQPGSFSLSSFLFMAGFFSPFMFQLNGERRLSPLLEPDGALRVFANVATFLAVCGMVQYGAQFVIGARYAFPIEFYLPDSLRVLGYNNLNPLAYGAKVFKSNGIFMLEPSTFSQVTALGLLFELSFWARKSRLAIYVAALALTYSGTGLLILAVGLAALVVFNRRWDIIVLGAIALCILAIFAEPLQLNVFVDRISEIQSTGSSGFARFGAWIYMFRDFWAIDPVRVLIGAGAGTFNKYALMSQYVAAEMGFSKVFFEFGLIGGSIYFYTLIRLIMMQNLPIACTLGVCTLLLLNGAYSPTVMGILTSVLLWPVASARLNRQAQTHRSETD